MPSAIEASVPFKALPCDRLDFLSRFHRHRRFSRYIYGDYISSAIAVSCR
jgi:hypothetical protein